MKIFAVSGSMRKGSFNSALLRAAEQAMPVGVTLDIGSVREVPLYDGDAEAEHGIPAPVAALKERAAAADAILLVTPEYNGGVPGVFKNAIDWMSRPAADIPRVFRGKPVGVIGATPGPVGTRLAQTAWLPILRALGMQPYFGHTLYVDGAAKAFDASLALVDEKVRERLTAYLKGFHAFAQSLTAR